MAIRTGPGYSANPTDNVYHYTSSEAALLGILSSGKIRLSSFANVNDPRESKRNINGFVVNTDSDIQPSGQDGMAVNQYTRTYLGTQMKVACFTRDYMTDGSMAFGDELTGWSHAAQWAHYAGRHSGICLEFSATKLEDCLRQQLAEYGPVFYGDVEYYLDEFSLVPISEVRYEYMREFGLDAALSHYIERHYQTLFLRKHSDWQSEHEYRLLFLDPTGSMHPRELDIRTALTGIYVGPAFQESRISMVYEFQERYPDVSFYRIYDESDGRPVLQRMARESLIEILAQRKPPFEPTSTGPLTERLALLRAADAARLSSRSEPHPG
ncbi:DUF2971 domain-containing protein [Microlunatus parietis]|uniref:DUF2971 domain-containing protein n=1 Tax=Microlunatus parietis TaxID=682979 RepID=A0A7Y9I7H5_9ACTN|nr:DUF2971 domain-containing protein [Microlunatus parietis]NYE71718.1 hypothetical protein [Microlunatus parietis]